MVVKNLTNFLNDSDKYGQNVGNWALQAGDGDGLFNNNNNNNLVLLY